MSMHLKGKSDQHWARKIWHASGVMLMALVQAHVPLLWSWVILFVLALLIIPGDFLRLKRPALNETAHRLFGRLMRKHESNALSGLTFLIFGTAIILLLFPQHVVTLTLLFLAVGDPFASYIGIKLGRDKIVGNKTLQGSIGAFAICTFVAVLFFYWNNLMIERLIIVAPLSGLIAAGAELAPIGKLDDNLTFPVLSAAGLWLLFHLFGGFGL